MTDQTPRDQPAAATTSSFLSDAERRKLEHLTAKGDPRFRADAQNQALLERIKHWFRILFMRQDHGRWRISKTKGIAYVTLAAAALAFWNYYPRPHLGTAFDAPRLPIGSSVITPPPASPIAPSTPTRATQPLEQRPEVTVTAPPKMPAARLEIAALTPTIKSEPAPSSTASYDPYQNEPVNQISSPSRVTVQPPPNLTGLSSGLEVDGTRLPTFGAIAATRNSKPRVAPAPTALVKGKSVWNLTPKPLIEHGTSDAVTPLETEPTSNTSRGVEPLATVGTDAQVANVPAPLVNAREEQDLLGQAGILVDVGADGKESNATSDSAASSQNGVLFDATRASKTPSSQPGTSSNQTAAKAPNLLEPGTRVNAKLVVGVIAVQGQESPVVAQLEGGAIAFGKTSLNPSGRVQITLLEVVKEGVSSQVNGSALGTDGFPGLSVELRQDSPDVVGKLWQAGLQGVSSYAQNVIEGATTTIANGATSVTEPQANLGLSLLQSLAQTFLTPPNQTSIKYARLEPQTPFEVLFMPTK